MAATEAARRRQQEAAAAAVADEDLSDEALIAAMESAERVSRTGRERERRWS